MTTLGNSYTVPMTLEEWVQCVPWLKDDPMAEYVAKCAFVVYGNGKIAKEPRKGMVRLSVPRFLDLWHDRIVLWRLEEVGFSSCATPDMMLMSTSHGILCAGEDGVWFGFMRVM